MRMVFQAQQLRGKEGEWETVSGRIRVFIQGKEKSLPLDDAIHLGDQVELVGELTPLTPPSNPGERDFESSSLDAGIRLRLQITPSKGSCQRLEQGWSSSLGGWLSQVRNWGKKVLQTAFPSDPVQFRAWP